MKIYTARNCCSSRSFIFKICFQSNITASYHFSLDFIPNQCWSSTNYANILLFFFLQILFPAHNWNFSFYRRFDLFIDHQQQHQRSTNIKIVERSNFYALFEIVDSQNSEWIHLLRRILFYDEKFTGDSTKNDEFNRFKIRMKVKHWITLLNLSIK